MDNIYFVLIIMFLIILVLCNKTQSEDKSEEIIIQKFSSTTDRLDPKDLLYLPEYELRNPIIQASKNVTNDRKDHAYITYDFSYTIDPKYRFHPENKHQVTFILNKKKFGSNIRVSGSNNTFNDISITKDTIIRTDNFKNILNIDINKKQVTVESGILLINLNNILKNYNLSLPVLPDCMNHSIGGAISTSVHGTCINKGSLSSYIVDITMVLPTGKIKTFTKRDKEYKALTTGLGFIYSVTIQCIEPFLIRHEEIISNWNDIYPNLKTYLSSNNLLQIKLIDPYDSRLPCVVLLRKINRMKEIEIQIDSDRNLNISDSHQIYENHQLNEKYTEQEIGVSLKNLGSAVHNIVTIIKNYKKEFNLTSNFPIVIQFSGKDKNSYLSSSKRKITAWISIYNKASDVKKDCLDKMTREIEDLLILKYKGRPNYSKRNFLDQEKMSLLYGHCYRDFQYIRNSLDPERLFTNEYIKRVIGD